MVASVRVQVHVHVREHGLVQDVQHVSVSNTIEIISLNECFSGLFPSMFEWWYMLKSKHLYMSSDLHWCNLYNTYVEIIVWE